MKKNHILPLLLAGLMTLALTACGGTAPAPQAPDVGSLSTLGDALAVDTEYYHSTWDEEHYVYVFDYNGAPTRVVADLTEELSQQIDDSLFSEGGGGEDAVRELLSPLPLTQIEDLSLGIPDQAELDKLVGKTGQELLDDGYEIWGSSIDGPHASYTLAKGLFQYEVTFEDDPSLEDAEDTDAAMAGLTVAAVAYDGVSDYSTDLSLTP